MSEQNRPEPDQTDDTGPPLATRRALLAAGGTLALGALAGCSALDELMDRAGDAAVGPTDATPAAAFAGVGVGDGDPFPARHSNTYRLSPVVRADAGPRSGEVELEGWVTTQITTEDYNSTRSNRSAANPVDIVDDDVDEDDETFRAALELEAELQDAADRAVASISKRSARTGRNPQTGKEITAALDDMDGTLSELRSVLGRCFDESCVAALVNVDRMETAVQEARVHVDSEEWDAAIDAIDNGGDGEDIIVRDYLVPVEDRPLDDEERATLVEYLTGSPVVGERFTVCLPDARAPGDNGSIAEAATPQRVIDHVTGRAADGNGKLYAWGRSEPAKAVSGNGGDDCDDADTEIRPGEVCGSTPHFVSATSGPTATGGGLESTRASDGTVTVVNTPPRAGAGATILVCPVDGAADEPSDLSEWGSESGASAETPTVVCQVVVQPPECPVPVRALLYVKRCRNDEQLVYTGGWVLDTAGLYEESVTMLTLAGETRVVGMDITVDGECCFDYSDAVSRSLSSERALRGARTSGGTVDSLVASGVLSDAAMEELAARDPVRASRAFVTHTALDCPVVHLVNARAASDAVKFKTGAELSKSVN